jgi:hypothetical protein
MKKFLAIAVIYQQIIIVCFRGCVKTKSPADLAE